MADPKNDAKKEQNTEVTTVCELDLDSIFIALHNKAISLVKGARILNSAVNDKGEFLGAGEHIIAALPEKGDIIYKKDAVVALLTYVQWFNGPEVAKTVTDQSLVELKDETDKSSSDKESDEKSDDEKTEESVFLKFPKFLTYLTEESGDTSGDDDKESKEKTKGDPGEQSETAKGYYIAYGIEIEGEKGSPLSDALKTFGKGLLKGLGILSFDWRTGAKGDAHTLGDMLKSFDAVFGKISPDEFQSRFSKNLKSKYPQATSLNTTFFDKGTLIQHLKKKLKPADTKKILSSDYSFCVKIPHDDKSDKLITKNVIADLVTQSVKGIFKKFSNKMSADDVILINTYNGNEKVEKNDPAAVQSSTTESIKINKEKNKLFLVEKLLLLEDSGEEEFLTVKERQQILTDLLTAALKSSLSEKFKSVIIDRLQAIIAKLDKSGIKSNKNSAAIEELKKHEYGFLIETVEDLITDVKNKDEENKTNTEDDQQKLTDSSETKKESKTTINRYLQLLFEDSTTSVDNNFSETLSILEKTIKDTWIKFLKDNKILPLLTNIEDPAIIQCISDAPIKANESILRVFTIANLIFNNREFAKEIKTILYENLNTNISVSNLLLEGHSEEYNQLIEEIKRIGLLGIVDNLDKIRKDFYKYLKEFKQKLILNYKTGKLKNKELYEYIQKIFDNSKNWINTEFLALLRTNMKDEKKLIEYVDKKLVPTLKTKGDFEKYELAQLLKALKDIPDRKEEPKEEDKDESDNIKVKIIFKDIDPEDPENTGKQKEVKTIEIDDPDEIQNIINKDYADVPEHEGFEGGRWNISKDKLIDDLETYFLDPENNENIFDDINSEKANESYINKYLTGRLLREDTADNKDNVKEIIITPNYVKIAIVDVIFNDIDPEDPENESKWKELEKFEITKDNIKDVKYPDPPEHEGFEFVEWDKAEDDLNKELEQYFKEVEKEVEERLNDSIKIKYKLRLLNEDNKDSNNKQIIIKPVYNAVEKEEPEEEPEKTDTPEKLIISWVCSDINGFLDKIVTIIPMAPKKEFKDPTNEKNRKIVEPIGDPIPYNPNKPDEELELPEPPEFKGYKFEKWNPDLEAIKNIAKKTEKPIKVIAEYTGEENTTDLKRDNGQYNFYIIPMKNLKMDGQLENTESDDEKAAAGETTSEGN